MNDQRALIGAQHPDLDQIDGPIRTQKQSDIVIPGIVGNGDEVTQRMPDVRIGEAMTMGTGHHRRLPQLHTVSIP